MVYLWDVSDGGQTAFPAAGVAGINDDAALLDVREYNERCLAKPPLHVPLGSG